MRVKGAGLKSSQGTNPAGAPACHQSPPATEIASIRDSIMGSATTTCTSAVEYAPSSSGRLWAATSSRMPDWSLS